MTTEGSTKSKKIILCLGILFIISGFILSNLYKEDPKVETEEFNFLYGISSDEVEIVEGVPYLYTHLSETEGKIQDLFYPKVVNSYLYSDSAGLSWMPQKEKIELLEREYFQKITEQKVIGIYQKKRTFWTSKDPDALYVKNSDGDMIPLVKDFNQIVYSNSKLDELKEILRAREEEYKKAKQKEFFKKSGE